MPSLVDNKISKDKLNSKKNTGYKTLNLMSGTKLCRDKKINDSKSIFVTFFPRNGKKQSVPANQDAETNEANDNKKIVPLEEYIELPSAKILKIKQEIVQNSHKKAKINKSQNIIICDTGNAR